MLKESIKITFIKRNKHGDSESETVVAYYYYSTTIRSRANDAHWLNGSTRKELRRRS